MNWHYLELQSLVQMRQAELLREAERQRLVATARTRPASREAAVVAWPTLPTSTLRPAAACAGCAAA